MQSVTCLTFDPVNDQEAEQWSREEELWTSHTHKSDTYHMSAAALRQIRASHQYYY